MVALQSLCILASSILAAVGATPDCTYAGGVRQRSDPKWPDWEDCVTPGDFGAPLTIAMTMRAEVTGDMTLFHMEGQGTEETDFEVAIIGGELVYRYYALGTMVDSTVVETVVLGATHRYHFIIDSSSDVTVYKDCARVTNEIHAATLESESRYIDVGSNINDAGFNFGGLLSNLAIDKNENPPTADSCPQPQVTSTATTTSAVEATSTAAEETSEAQQSTAETTVGLPYASTSGQPAEEPTPDGGGATTAAATTEGAAATTAGAIEDAVAATTAAEAATSTAAMVTDAGVATSMAVSNVDGGGAATSTAASGAVATEAGAVTSTAVSGVDGGGAATSTAVGAATTTAVSEAVATDAAGGATSMAVGGAAGATSTAAVVPADGATVASAATATTEAVGGAVATSGMASDTAVTDAAGGAVTSTGAAPVAAPGVAAPAPAAGVAGGDATSAAMDPVTGAPDAAASVTGAASGGATTGMAGAATTSTAASASANVAFTTAGGAGSTSTSNAASSSSSGAAAANTTSGAVATSTAAASSAAPPSAANPSSGPAAVLLSMELLGMDAALLGNASAMAAALRAIDAGLLSAWATAGVASGDLSSSFPAAAARRLAAGLRCDVGIASSGDAAPSQLLSSLQAAEANMTAAVAGRLSASADVGAYRQPPISIANVLFSLADPSLESDSLAATATATTALLPQLRTKENATTVLPDGNIVTVSKLSRRLQEAGPGRVDVAVPGTAVAVSLPAATFKEFAPPGEELVLAVAVPPAPQGGEAVAMVAISLLQGSGEHVPVKALREPVTFSLPLEYAGNLTCAFYDEALRGWSQSGVGLAKGNEEGAVMRCSTWHFSLFGAVLKGFVDAVLCSQFKLFTPEAISGLAEGDWAVGKGAILHWFTLGVFLLIFLLAVAGDRRREKSAHPQMELFLVPAGKVEDEELPSAAASCACCGAMACFACGDCKQTLLGSVLDEVVGEWFEQFSELRALIEDVCYSIECGAPSVAGFMRASHNLMRSLMCTSAQHAAAAAMGLSLDSVAFVMEDEDLKGVLAQRLRSGKEPFEGEGGWEFCKNSQEAWARLHAEVGFQVLRRVPGPASRPSRIVSTFLLYSPLGIMLAHDVFMSRKMRVFLFLNETIGAVAVVSFFFVASGSLRGKKKVIDPACGDQDLQEDFAYLLGRDVAVAIGSVVLSGFPVIFLQSCHTRGMRLLESEGCPEWVQQLKRWSVQDAIIYILGAIYLAFANFFICTFLANVAEEDSDEWTRMIVLTFFWDQILLPLGMALAKPMLADLFLLFNSKVTGVDRETVASKVETHLVANSNLLMLKII